jgi:hypothetical protein
LSAKAYPATALTLPVDHQPCPTSAVCFRTAAGFEIKITSSVTKRKRNPTENTREITVPFPAETLSVLAPVLHPMGVLYFNRRAFVTNTTTAKFTNGMLTSLQVKDPSSLVQFLSLPVEVLKSVAILVKL